MTLLCLLSAGVGTRDYYRKLGYVLEGPYMVKSLLANEDDNLWDMDLLED